MKIVVSPEYENLRQWLLPIDKLMNVPDCDLLHDGRNKIVLCHSPHGERLVIKKYKKHDIIKTIAYTIFRPSKAKRAFYNAIELRKRGFDTPCEVAYLEKKKFGFITQVYYVSLYSGKDALSQHLKNVEPFDKELAASYAEYVALLHEKGVLHVDLNSTNVLFSKECGKYGFSLIDINRMRFFNATVPKAECMENLTLFWYFDDVFRYVLNVYAQARGWNNDDVENAIRVKQRHDRNWIRRKKFTRFLKKCVSIR